MPLARFLFYWLALASGLIAAPMATVHRVCEAGLCY